jgi:hypothetical protein
MGQQENGGGQEEGERVWEGKFGDLGFIAVSVFARWAKMLALKISPRAGRSTYRLTVGRDSLPTNDLMRMEEIPTNRWTPKFHTFSTERLSLHKEIVDQQFDRNYAD